MTLLIKNYTYNHIQINIYSGAACAESKCVIHCRLKFNLAKKLIKTLILTLIGKHSAQLFKNIIIGATKKSLQMHIDHVKLM